MEVVTDLLRTGSHGAARELVHVVGGVQLGSDYTFIYQVPHAITTDVEDGGKVVGSLHLAANTQIYVNARWEQVPRRGPGSTGEQRFVLSIQPSPHGFLKLSAGLGRWLIPPRLEGIRATLVFGDEVKFESLALDWRKEGFQAIAFSWVDSLQWVEENVSGMANSMAQSISRWIVDSQTRGVRDTVNQLLVGPSSTPQPPSSQLVEELLKSIGIDTLPDNATTCSALNWLGGFRQVTFRVDLTEVPERFRHVESGAHTLALEPPISIDFAVLYDPARGTLLVRFQDRSWGPRSEGSGARRPGIYVGRKEGSNSVKVVNLVFEHDLRRIGGGRFVGVEISPGEGLAVNAYALLLMSLNLQRPLDGFLPHVAAELLHGLNAQVGQAVAALEVALSKAAAALPADLAGWVNNLRTVIAGNQSLCRSYQTTASAR